jgi:hypothetical protein
VTGGAHAHKAIRELTFRVRGLRAVHVLAPKAVLDRFGAMGRVRDAEIFVSRKGIRLNPAGMSESVNYLPGGGHWTTAFGALLPPESALFRGQRVPICLTGMLAAQVIRILCDWQRPPRGRGGPKRAERWFDDKEEFFARVLGSIAKEGDDDTARVTRAIVMVAAQQRELFERTFAGDEGIEAARRDYYRRMEEFTNLPAGAIPLGRIMGMRFEFEEDSESE